LFFGYRAGGGFAGRFGCLEGGMVCLLFFCCVIEEEGLRLHFEYCGLGCFSLLGFACLLFEEKKGLDKENLLLQLPTGIFNGFVLGCFWLLGLEMLTD